MNVDRDSPAAIFHLALVAVVSARPLALRVVFLPPSFLPCCLLPPLLSAECSRALVRGRAEHRRAEESEECRVSWRWVQAARAMSELVSLPFAPRRCWLAAVDCSDWANATEAGGRGQRGRGAGEAGALRCGLCAPACDRLFVRSLVSALRFVRCRCACVERVCVWRPPQLTTRRVDAADSATQHKWTRQRNQQRCSSRKYDDNSDTGGDNQLEFDCSCVRRRWLCCCCCRCCSSASGSCARA